MALHIGALWRYPVKSMAGEPLDIASISSDGIAGDRLVHVRGPEGVRTARRHYRLLGLRGTLSPEGHVLVNGLPWESPQALSLVKAAAGDDAWLADYDGPERFDILSLLVATDGAVASFGRDVRRLRPNILIAGVDGLAERSWPGRELRLHGDPEAGPVIRLVSLRGRCAMTIVDPDTLVRDHDVLRDIGRRFDGKLALDAEAIRPGEIRAGAEVEVSDPR